MSIADLTISAGRVTQDLNSHDLRLRIDVTVDNIGSATAGSSRVGYYLSTNSYISTYDTLLGSDFVGMRHVNGEQSEHHYVNVTDLYQSGLLTSAPGTHDYFLGAVADYQGTVAEASESNNGNGFNALAKIVVKNGGGGSDWMHAFDDAYYIMTGNGGADQFIFHTPVGHGPNHVVHSITDFTSGVDQIKLHQHHFPGFPGLPFGTLDDSRFQVSYNDAANATGSQATMLYNPNTGLLAFDSDGAGSAAALPVVKLGQGHRDLAAADIAVVWAG